MGTPHGLENSSDAAATQAVVNPVADPLSLGSAVDPATALMVITMPVDAVVSTGRPCLVDLAGLLRMGMGGTPSPSEGDL